MSINLFSRIFALTPKRFLATVALVVACIGLCAGQTNQGPTNFVNVLNSCRMNGVRMVDAGNVCNWPGTTADAWIAAACSDLPAGGGSISAWGFGATSQNLATTINCGSPSKPVTFYFDPATQFHVTSDIDFFQPDPNNKIYGFHAVATSGFTHSVLKYANNIYDNKQATGTQNTYAFGINCDLSTIQTGTCVTMQSDDVNYVDYVTLQHIRGAGGLNGIWVHATGSGTGRWVADNHFDDVQFTDTVNGYNWQADKGNIERNLCIHCTYQKDTHTTEALIFRNAGGGVFEGNVFREFEAFDTTTAVDLGSGSNMTRNVIDGGWDGACVGNCGGLNANNDVSYNTVVNKRFANTGLAYNIGSAGGIWVDENSGAGIDFVAADLNKRLWMHVINGAGMATNGCDVGQVCTEFGSSGIGIGLVVQHGGNGSVRAGGTGAGGFVANYIQSSTGGGGAFLTIPTAGNSVVSDTATQTLSGKSTAAGPLTGTVGSGTAATAGTAIGAGTSQTLAITVSGALTTDVAQCSTNAAYPATWLTGITVLPPVVTANTVTVTLTNPSAGSITPAAQTFRCTVTR